MLFLRPCTADDVPNATQMLCRAYAEKPWKEKWPLERAEKRVKAFMSVKHARSFALIIETQVVGYLFGRITPNATEDVFYVDELFVHPNYQRKGVGSMALSQLQDDLKQAGISTMELHTIADDLNFCVKNGFSESGYVNLIKKF